MDKQIKDQAILMKRTIRVAGVYLASTTAYTVWAMSAGFFPSLNDSLEWWLRIAACIGMYFFIDAGLSAQANYVFRGWIQKDLRKAAFFFLFLTTLIFAVRFLATTFMTYVAAQPMATAIYSPPDNTDRRNSILQAQSNTKATQDELKREYNRLRKSERVRIAEAKKSGEASINEAINSEGVNVAQLYRNGNSWVMKDRRFRKYRERISEARKEALNLIEAERANTQAAQVAYMQALTGKDEIAGVLADDLKTTNETYLQNKNSIAGAIYVVDFIAAFIMFALSWVLALYEKKYQVAYENKFGEVWERLTNKYHEDVLNISEKAGMELWQFFVGLPLEKLTTFFRWLKLWLWVKVIGSLENLLRIDIDRDGVIGTPDSDKIEAKAEAMSDKSATKGEIREIGFRRIAATTASDKSATKPDLSAIVGVTTTTSDSDKYTPAFVAEKITSDYSDKSATKPERKIKPATKKPATKPAASDKDLKRIADATRAAYNRMKEKEAEILKQGGLPKDDSAYRRKQTTYEVNYRAALDAGHTVTFEKGKIIIVAPERGKK